MNSTPPPKQTEPHDAPAARADERLAHAREQIKRADEQLARLTEQVAKMERDDAHPPSARSAPQSDPQSPRKLAFRTLAALPLAACIIVVALVLQSSYGDGAKRGAPQLASTQSAPPENPSSPAEPTPSTVQVAGAAPAPPQASSPQAPSLAEAPSPQASPPQAPTLAQATPPQDAAPPAAAAAPEPTQLLQTIARDLANLERNIEQLRANQQQMASDNAKAIGDLKATQEEMKRALAKASEQNPPKVSAPATQRAPTFRKPERSQARSRPRYPREWMYDDYDW
ncbi:hypothetical protein J6524_26245 [Bradyrhizobium sp. WSM 1738]|uniref:hypothetical protein n=1 Tax=Bradyrhizobium hereditatis TaxID=2821405 RepID=UPI001CE237C3|nr:hypothetical protein [Bradyrhizobium hereditatis]MCA6118349.1 hypothetical protein [Bradyrhizobium hereditatis]